MRQQRNKGLASQSSAVRESGEMKSSFNTCDQKTAQCVRGIQVAGGGRMCAGTAEIWPAGLGQVQCILEFRKEKVQRTQTV